MQQTGQGNMVARLAVDLRAERRARRAEDRAGLQDPLVVYREDDGEIDTPAGGA